MANRKTTLKCAQCAKPIVKTQGSPRKKKFCGDICRWRFHNQERTDALKTVRAMRRRGSSRLGPQMVGDTFVPPLKKPPAATA